MLQISSTEKSFIVIAVSVEEKNKWLQALLDAIAKAQEEAQNKGELPKNEVKAAATFEPDKNTGYCPLCLKDFKSITRRRHHCRNCGKVVCGPCSQSRHYLAPGVHARICDKCFREIRQLKRTQKKK